MQAKRTTQALTGRITVKDTAELLGVSSGTVSSWKNGRSKPNVKNAEALSNLWDQAKSMKRTKSLKLKRKRFKKVKEKFKKIQPPGLIPRGCRPKLMNTRYYEKVQSDYADWDITSCLIDGLPDPETVGDFVDKLHWEDNWQFFGWKIVFMDDEGKLQSRSTHVLEANEFQDNLMDQTATDELHDFFGEYNGWTVVGVCLYALKY